MRRQPYQSFCGVCRNDPGECPLVSGPKNRRDNYCPDDYADVVVWMVENMTKDS